MLAHKRLKMIRGDFENCVRLLHTIERQIFDVNLHRASQRGQEARRGQRRAANSSKNLVVKRREAQDENRVELQIFELLDLFIRDSSLGLFESRLKFLRVVQESLDLKYVMMSNDQESSPSGLVVAPKLRPAEKMRVMTRLRKVLNILHFILGYYSQFKPKLASTIARLDA